jgi:2-polyprenyl-3-methyl-5-hydroxy-6-metoxy-1,4-benzoquinol methylase
MKVLDYFRSRDVDADKWLDRFTKFDDIVFVSDNRSYAHAESEYDARYGHADAEFVEKTIGTFVLDALPRVPSTVLELACGTGLLTASLIHDGRIKRLIASDASVEFLRIAKKKTRKLPRAATLKLACIKDSDFDKIPSGAFDAIMMRSALHHFVDFKNIAATLIQKVKPNGSVCMLEPRADFQICTSLILKGAKERARADGLNWSDKHDSAVSEFVAMTEFYLDRMRDKKAAEDKYSFHIEEFLQIADRAGASLRCIGGEGVSTFSTSFRDFLVYCMSFGEDVVNDIVSIARDELKFMDGVYASRPRYAAAEWFVFQK